jgi:hypothetical protein
MGRGFGTPERRRSRCQGIGDVRRPGRACRRTLAQDGWGVGERAEVRRGALADERIGDVDDLDVIDFVSRDVGPDGIRGARCGGALTRADARALLGMSVVPVVGVFAPGLVMRRPRLRHHRVHRFGGRLRHRMVLYARKPTCRHKGEGHDDRSDVERRSSRRAFQLTHHLAIGAPRTNAIARGGGGSLRSSAEYERDSQFRPVLKHRRVGHQGGHGITITKRRGLHRQGVVSV